MVLLSCQRRFETRLVDVRLTVNGRHVVAARHDLDGRLAVQEVIVIRVPSAVPLLEQLPSQMCRMHYVRRSTVSRTDFKRSCSWTYPFHSGPFWQSTGVER